MLHPWKLAQVPVRWQNPRAKPKQNGFPLGDSKVFLLCPPWRTAAGVRPAEVVDAVQAAGMCPALPHRKQCELATRFAGEEWKSPPGALRLRDDVEGAAAAGARILGAGCWIERRVKARLSIVDISCSQSAADSSRCEMSYAMANSHQCEMAMCSTFLWCLLNISARSSP